MKIPFNQDIVFKMSVENWLVLKKTSVTTKTLLKGFTGREYIIYDSNQNSQCEQNSKHESGISL